MVVVLHNIRSIHNVASIFRTADGLGVEKIYLCGITPTPVDQLGHYRQQFLKVSLGSERTIDYEKIVSTEKIIDQLKEDGYLIVSVEQDKKAIDFNKFKTKKRKIAVVMGAEISGVPGSILKRSDKILEIPMDGKKDSLNVSIAFGIVGYRIKYRC